MKKIWTLLTALVLVAAMGSVAFAAPNNFAKSPEAQDNLKVYDYESLDDCEGEIILTPYRNRETLDERNREQLEEARREAEEASSVAELAPEVKEIAKELGLSTERLAVADLFDLHVNDCIEHLSTVTGVEADHGRFIIRLNNGLASRYVCLLSYAEGEWMVVDNAHIEKNNLLKFQTDRFGAFAMIVKTDEGRDTPPTGSDWTDHWAVWASASVLFAGMAAVALIYKRKENA